MQNCSKASRASTARVRTGAISWPDKLTVRYAGHEDIIQAGEVYDMAPGHTMAAEAGTVLIEFSPKEAFRELTEIAEKTLGQR